MLQGLETFQALLYLTTKTITGFFGAGLGRSRVISKRTLFDTDSFVRLKKPAEVNQGYLKGLSRDTYLVKSDFIHMSGAWTERNWYVL
jgi:hypothetical protein